MAEQNEAVEAIFLAALDKATSQERLAYVEGACAGNPALLRRVRELLDSHQESKGPLDVPPPALAVTPGSQSSEEPGTMIGPYKLLEQIGEGGMGTVFMAAQSHPVQRKVALKIIKPGMDSRQVIGRFEAERQALALMDHPNIAKVLDAGAIEAAPPPPSPINGEGEKSALQREKGEDHADLATRHSPLATFFCFQQLTTVAICNSFAFKCLQQWGGCMGDPPFSIFSFPFSPGGELSLEPIAETERNHRGR